ncbi:hypothetical protein PGT21_009004 [Puccinia graminis f. sp. tritici]|uniref:Uncharacterized protein n=1 Tax=Puccinia graminis f. sp. tritici TaxID=56615 RepID=A0A5B0S6E1_PUCGR|nr:hypothetical protein PGT21_009004 [Puccinia graminis f. sp. tritici]KAA1133470.1 hypothetical protein PGTUg99_015478 [Puccinia graminis f. sp. tritici]
MVTHPVNVIRTNWSPPSHRAEKRAHPPPVSPSGRPVLRARSTWSQRRHIGPPGRPGGCGATGAI